MSFLSGTFEIEHTEGRKGVETGADLPNDSGEMRLCPELPNDSGEIGAELIDLPKDMGDGKDLPPKTFHSLDEMKTGMDKNELEIREEKPPHSPDLAKWYENGGSVSVETKDGKNIWIYTDAEGRHVPYIDGYPVFPPEAKHPMIEDINIGAFTGDRNADKQLYLEKLKAEYGLTEIPAGYTLHHDSQNGIMQLVDTGYHTEFTHAGGHSLFKEELSC